MYAVAYGITRDPDRAADAVQQALIAMWRDLPSLRDVARFEGWSYRLVVRSSLQELRGRARIKRLSLDARAGDRDVATDVALRDQLERGIAAMTPDHRAVLVLRHLVGLPIDEIADVLAIPRGTVASRLHHATNALRAAIEAGNRPALAGGQQA
jgi:RNA polymerase sigma-70 factor (ECF subfamily)